MLDFTWCPRIVIVGIIIRVCAVTAVVVVIDVITCRCLCHHFFIIVVLIVVVIASEVAAVASVVTDVVVISFIVVLVSFLYCPRCCRFYHGRCRGCCCCCCYCNHVCLKDVVTIALLLSLLYLSRLWSLLVLSQV